MADGCCSLWHSVRAYSLWVRDAMPLFYVGHQVLVQVRIHLVVGDALLFPRHRFALPRWLHDIYLRLLWPWRHFLVPVRLLDLSWLGSPSSISMRCILLSWWKITVHVDVGNV
jgi:hypothetical protein